MKAGQGGRRSRHAPTAWLAEVGLAIALLVSTGATQGSDVGREAVIQETHVPQGRPDKWPPGRWIPIPAEQYRALIGSVHKSSSEPRPLWMNRAEYEATFDPSTRRLIDGSLTVEFGGLDTEPAVVTLDPVNLGISALNWNSAPAIWGVGPDGHTHLLVRPGEKTLKGRWSLAGRPILGHAEFRMSLIPATVSQMTLLIPSEYTVSSTIGDVTRTTDEPQEGMIRWRIQLGSATDCVLTVQKTANTSQQPQLVLCQQDTACIVRQTEVEVQTVFQIDVRGRPASTLAFLVSKSLEIAKITMDGQFPVDWKEVTARSGRRRLVRIRLPSPWQGRSHSLDIHGFVRNVSSADLRLPQVILQEGTFSQGQMTLSIETPLVLRTFRGTGLRQTRSMWTDEGTQQLVFDQFLPNPTVAITVGLPRQQLTADVLTRVDLGSDKWNLKAEVDWECKTGGVFETTCQIPPEWEITDVRMRPGLLGADLVDWSVQSSADAPAVLRVEFRDALLSGSSKGVIISAKRLAGPANSLIHIPAVVPLGCDEFKVDVALLHPADRPPTLAAETDFETTDEQTLAGRWQDSTLWSRDFSRDDRNVLFLRGTSPINVGVFSMPDADNPSAKSEPFDAGGRVETPALESAKRADVTPRVATATLVSHLLTSGERFVEHAATFEILDWPEQEGFEFELQRPAMLVGVFVNDSAVPATRRQDRYAVPALRGEVMRRVAISYTTSLESTFLSASFHLSPPRVPWQILQLKWRMAVPPEYAINDLPVSLRWESPQNSRGWTVRLFGPLARSDETPAFDPFQANSWKRLIARPALEAAASAGRTDVPPGWHQYKAIGTTQPEASEVTMWNGARMAACAWSLFFACALGGVLLTRSGWLRHRAWPAIWFGACLAITVAATAPFDRLSGACLSGSLLVFILSRPWFAGGQQAKNGTQTATTVSMRTLSASVLLIGLTQVHGMGQEPFDSLAPPTRTSPLFSDIARTDTTSQILHVLIPTDSEKVSDAQSSIVYVDADDWRRFKANVRQRTHRSDYAIPSAVYRVDVDEREFVVLKAELRVFLLGTEEVIPIQLPFTNVNLGGVEACRVDGKPCPILRARDGPGFVLSLKNQDENSSLPANTKEASDLRLQPPAPSEPSDKLVSVANRLHTLELTLHPTVRQTRSSNRIELGLPDVPSSHLEVQFQKQVDTVHVASQNAAVRYSQDELPPRIPLGKTDRLTLEWVAEAPSAASDADDIAAETVCMVEVQHAMLRYHYRVRYDPGKTEIRQVAWRIPNDVVVRKQDVMADDVLDTQVRSRGDSQQLRILFAQPKSQPFWVQASWVVPVTSSNDVLDIPVQGVLDRAGSSQVDRVGLAARSGFRIEPRFGPETSVVPLSAVAFSESWDPLPSAARIQAAYQLGGATSVPVRLVPPVPEQTVRTDEVLHVHRNRCDWSVHAEIETRDAVAFRYTLRVDPRLRIESVSVKEDDAERLAHWSMTTRTQLVLFLKDGTSDVQYVTIKGHMPITRSAPVPLPSVKFEGAEQESGSVLLYREPGLAVTWDGTLQPERVDEPPMSTADESQEIVVGRYALTQSTPTPAIRVSVQRARVRCDSVVLLEPIESRTWRYTTFLRCRSLGSGLRRLRLLVPAEMARDYEFLPLGAVQVRETETPRPDGAVELTLRMTAQKTDQMILSVQARVEAPTSGVWRLPCLDVPEAVQTGRYLVVASRPRLGSESTELGLTADPGQSEEPTARLGWRPIELPNEANLIDTVPDWIRNVLGAAPLAAPDAIYRADSGWWSLAPFKLVQTGAVDQVALLETCVWLHPKNGYEGRTRILSVQRASTEITVQLPPATRVDTLLRDGDIMPLQTRTPGRLTVPVDVVRMSHTIEVFWRRQTPRHARWWIPMTIEVPRVSNLPEKHTAMAILAPETMTVANRRWLRHDAAVEYLLERADGLLSYLGTNVGMEPRSVDVQAWHDLQRTLRDLAASVHHPFNQRLADSPRRRRLDSITERALRLEHRLARAGNEFEMTPSDPIENAGTHLFDADEFCTSRLFLPRPTVNVPDQIECWSVPKVLLTSLLAAFVLLAASVALTKISFPIVFQSFAVRRSVWMATIGAIWWLCLAPSAVGLLICVAAAVALRMRTPTQAASTERSESQHPTHHVQA